MAGKLEGKVALVTGSGQGVGRAIAIGFAQQGAKVVTNNEKRLDGSLTSGGVMKDEDYAKLSDERKTWFDRAREETQGDAYTTAETIVAMGCEATPCIADISKWDEAKRLVDFTVETYGRIDIVANIAGSFGFSPFDEISEELWDRVTSVKPKGYFNVMRHAVPYMKEQGDGGRIINCTSRAWLGDILRHVQYCTANAGVVGLTRGAAIELAEFGITCNAFSPWAKTRSSYELEAHVEVGSFKAALTDRPLATYEQSPEPERLVPFLVYLASDEGAKISGSIFELGGENIKWYSDPIGRKVITKYDGPWTIDEVFDAVERNFLPDYESIVPGL
ncbi:MAG: SDR family NAD(P)-dependent oxidoreductase [bacterium]|nr:SDR family NAD(P)-dependent oxidoreductase [bacterium]